jgi:hypothetical protein
LQGDVWVMGLNNHNQMGLDTAPTCYFPTKFVTLFFI